jgi:hypothetical protein
MTRRRPLTLAMIRRVRDELGISADLLLGHSEKKLRKRARPGKFERGPINSNSINSRRQTAPRRQTAAG